MRPRKAVLVVCANENRGGIYKLLLDVAGYRAEAVTGVETATVKHGLGVELVLGLGPLKGGAGNLWPALAAQMKAARPETPILLVDPRADVPHADLIRGTAAPHAELLGQVKVLATRKRGPRYGVRRPEPAPHMLPAAAWVGN